MFESSILLPLLFPPGAQADDLVLGLQRIVGNIFELRRLAEHLERGRVGVSDTLPASLESSAT